MKNFSKGFKPILTIVGALLLTFSVGYMFGVTDEQTERTTVSAESKLKKETKTVQVGENIIKDKYRGTFFLSGLSEEHFEISSGARAEYLITYEYPYQMTDSFKIRDTDIVLKPIKKSLENGTITFEIIK